MKILTVVGARPQFIKAAVVSRAIAEYNAENNENKGETPRITEIIVHTDQHYDTNMSDVFFEEMQIPKPDYHLGVGSGSHGAMTGRMLEKIEEVIMQEKPDRVLVYGDTNSTLAGALAAVKLHVPVAHVEAGLRSFNMQMPEEINRILTDRVSRWLFCPTSTAVKNLKKEGFPATAIYNTGDVMYDAVLFYKKLAKPTTEIVALLDRLQDGYYLATVHRAENTSANANLNNIINALETISKKTPVVLPLHPGTKRALAENVITLRNIIGINPVGYFDMLTLLASCKAVFTDSGGLQKEAYFFGKYCITLRQETEWVELVELGINTLAGADYHKILAVERNIDKQSADYTVKLYGDGNAGKKIVQILIREGQASKTALLA